MSSYEAKLLASAASEKDWPDSNLPEIIFVGRSNAGKSSLINALLNRKNLAYVGKTPGKTRLLNFFSVNDQWVFCDAPGYGYATRDEEAAIAFNELLEPCFEKRDALKAMLLVLDIRRTPSEDDLSMVEFGRHKHLPILVACCKSDKLSKNQIHNQLFKISKELDIPKTNLLPISSVKKTGLDSLWEEIYRVLELN